MLRELLGLLILSRAVSGTGLISFRHGVNLPTRRPLIIAHRGASGILPEHTRKIFVLLIFDAYEKCSVLKKTNFYSMLRKMSLKQTTVFI